MPDQKIKKIDAEEILDSRGQPTLKVTVFAGEAHAEFSVPAGSSIGQHEAVEKRDGDNSWFGGKGVKSAIESIKKEIEPALMGYEVSQQAEIDQKMIELDATANKARLGANSILGVSLACAKAAAVLSDQETFEYLRKLQNIKPFQKAPFLFINLINGGQHSQSQLAFQEYHIVPQTDDIEEALNNAAAVQRELKKVLIKEFGSPSANLGDEGGFVPQTDLVSQPLEILTQVIKSLGLESKIKLALDVAASSFYNIEKKNYLFDQKEFNSQELMDFYESLIQKFFLVSIEDPFYEEDFESFALLSSKEKISVVGDDLTVTNITRLQKAIDQKSINALIIKPNQIGTLTETLATIKLAQENNIKCIVSHRSGETNDDFIADLAAAFSCYGFKAGALQRGERVAKYNRLRHILKYKV